jgi:hypothetical protein
MKNEAIRLLPAARFGGDVSHRPHRRVQLPDDDRHRRSQHALSVEIDRVVSPQIGNSLIGPDDFVARVGQLHACQLCGGATLCPLVQRQGTAARGPRRFLHGLGQLSRHSVAVGRTPRQQKAHADEQQNQQQRSPGAHVNQPRS